MERYDSYKDSGLDWIGEIPSHWELKKIKNLYSERKEKNTDLATSFLSLMKDRGIIPYSEKGNIGNKTSDNIANYKWVHEDDLVINPMNVIIGSVGISKYRGVLSNVYIVLTSGPTLLSCFGGYVFQHIGFQKYLKRICYGIMELRESLNKIEFFTERIPIGTLHEQEQIVEYLDRKTTLIDSLIEKTVRKIELLKEKRTSLINEVVTKGLNPDVEMKDSRVEWIGEIPSHWLKIKLHTLVTSQKLEFQDGNHGGLHPLPEEFITEGVPFIKPKDIQKEKILWDSCDRLPFERCEQFRIGFSNNDDVLLVNRGGSIGKVVYVSDYDNEFSYFIINPQVTYMRGKNGLLSRYLFYVSISDIFQCGIDLIMGHGSTFPFLGLSNMGDFEIVFPEVSEQQQIVEYLDEQTQKIDTTISIEEKRIELLKEYRQSLISEAVTGKVKVTRDE
jgi:type I restriction enzyme S subunit